uniref:Uncharacterized protein n=1 Tax=Schlesneria paludicola TaxID=360056 RepID=A0A7C4QRF6_9PLAN
MRVHRTIVWSSPSRRGVTTPLVVAALLAALLCAALILDRLWLETAALELTTASEAAALAAARALASDERLRLPPDPQLLAHRALEAAVSAAEQNRVAGTPLLLNPASDIRIGRYVETSQGPDRPAAQFLETDHQATHVQVFAQRTRGRGHPVALLFPSWTRVAAGDVAVQVEAGLEHRVVGVRPFAGGPVPALPLAIWREDPAGQRTDTWRAAIEQRLGRDDLAYDAATHQVRQQADGLPELTLRSRPRSGAIDRVNVQLVDVGSAFDAERLARQFSRGWSTDDLQAWGGELRLGGNEAAGTAGLPLASTSVLGSADRDALEQIVGEPRIGLLYSTWAAGQRSAWDTTQCVEFVALRVLAVRDVSDGSAEVVVQPTVLATRTAMTDPAAKVNPYVCRLMLTR